jgi:hypothetical protein
MIAPSNFAHVSALELAFCNPQNSSRITSACGEGSFRFSARLLFYALLVCAFLSTTSTPQSDANTRLQVSSAPAIRNLWPRSPILETTAVKRLVSLDSRFQEFRRRQTFPSDLNSLTLTFGTLVTYLRRLVSLYRTSESCCQTRQRWNLTRRIGGCDQED